MTGLPLRSQLVGWRDIRPSRVPNVCPALPGFISFQPCHKPGPSALVSLVVQLVKNPPAMQDPWVWKNPWRRERLPTPVFWPGENSMDCIVHGVAESQTWLSNFHFQSFLELSSWWSKIYVWGRTRQSKHNALPACSGPSIACSLHLHYTWSRPSWSCECLLYHEDQGCFLFFLTQAA